MKQVSDILALSLQTAFWIIALNALVWMIVFQPVDLEGFRYVGF